MDRIRQGIPLLLALTTLGVMSFVASPYLSLFSSNHHSRSNAVDEVSDDSGDNAIGRGLMGGATGLALGLFMLFKKKKDED